MSWFTTTPHAYAPLPQISDAVLPKDSDASTSSAPKPPVIQSRNPPSWVELVPWDVRSLVLTELTKQPAFEAVQADLASYARTSKAASADVKAFHRQWRDPRASLLASRNLVQSAWEAAMARAWFSIEKEFISAIKSVASDFSAIVLDGRTGVGYQAYVPAAISALFESNVEHLHLRLGCLPMVMPRGPELQAIRTLITASMDRLKKGKSLPTIFLHVAGIPVRDIAAALKNSPVHLNIVGLSLCSDPCHSKIDAGLDELGNKQLFGGGREEEKLADWDALFSQLKDIRYLNLTGWEGEGLSEALNRWFHQFHQLEELHLPRCEITRPCFVGLSQIIENKTTFKCWAIDHLHRKPVPGYAGRADLMSALENNPDMRIIDYFDHPVLKGWPGMEPFWKEGRYIISSIPHAMRALPEIYGQVDFFKPATS